MVLPRKRQLVSQPLSIVKKLLKSKINSKAHSDMETKLPFTRLTNPSLVLLKNLPQLRKIVRVNGKSFGMMQLKFLMLLQMCLNTFVNTCRMLWKVL